MPTVYENEGHRRAMIDNYHRLAWKILEFRKDPYCRNPKCGKKMHNVHFGGNWKDKATVDHKVARCFGGSDTEENFELLCGKCNNKKAAQESKLLEMAKQLGVKITT